MTDVGAGLRECPPRESTHQDGALGLGVWGRDRLLLSWVLEVKKKRFKILILLFSLSCTVCKSHGHAFCAGQSGDD